MTHTLTLTAGRRAVNIRSDSSSVTDWAAQYFGPYWLANPSTGTKGPTVTATDADHQASAPSPIPSTPSSPVNASATPVTPTAP